MVADLGHDTMAGMERTMTHCPTSNSARHQEQIECTLERGRIVIVEEMTMVDFELQDTPMRLK